MHNILLVDTLKSSLVMTSEIFKDCVKGCQISIVNTGKECVDFLQHSPDTDMVVVDFNLPDTDGVVLSRHLKRSYKGPVIITAFPDRIVHEAIEKELYAYHDSSHWVQKPVRLNLFSSVIDQFLYRNRRLTKRFIYDAKVTCVNPSRSKKSPSKLSGQIQNISMGGMKIHLLDLNISGFKQGNSITVSFVPHDTRTEISIKATIVWCDESTEQFGVGFSKMITKTADILEDSLRNLEPIEDTLDYLPDEPGDS